MKIGDTFIPALPDAHLWIVLTEPNEEGKVVIVNLTSGVFDQSCILEPGDHPFVRHTSTIRYQKAMLCSHEKLEESVRAGSVRRREPVAMEIVKRIWRGALVSDYTPGKVAKEIKKMLGR